VVSQRLILLPLSLLCSHASTAAQVPQTRIVLAQEHTAPILARLPTASSAVRAASFLLSKKHGNPTPQVSFQLAGDEKFALKNVSLSLDHFRTSILTQSGMPLIEFFASRLQLDAFQNTFHVQNVQLSPFGNCGMQKSLRPQQVYSRSPVRSISRASACVFALAATGE
jgi:hypothetical protein